MDMIDRVMIRALNKKWKALEPLLDERQRRLWAGTEANVLGYGGASVLVRITGLAMNTVRVGMKDAEQQSRSKRRILEGVMRRPGAGRKALSETWPELKQRLASLVDDSTRGDPMSPLKWTSKSTEKLAEALSSGRRKISRHTVAKYLRDMDFSLQSNRKTHEGNSHPDRDKQFKYIAKQVIDFQRRRQPVVSVDAKKKELIGNYKKSGREWRKKGEALKVNAYDFKGPEGKALPFGVYDTGANVGWVSIGIDHDTASFAVETMRQWWLRMGIEAYPKAKALLVTADCGGSNGNRVRLWKLELQRFASEMGLAVTVCHFPPGTSKWNKIEHRMFSHITANWRARPLRSLSVVVNLIGHTTTKTGLKIRATVDKGRYPLKVKVSDEEMEKLVLSPHNFHGEWNYTIRPLLIS